MAVKVTAPPEQTLVDDALIKTLGDTFELIVTLILFPVPVPHELIGETETVPATVPKFTLIILVPDPEVIVAPTGTIQ